MIVSHKHKFIFVKLKKTAGTSMEIALSGICGPDDIITPISKKDELLRKKLGYRGAQNYEGKNLFNHILAKDAREALGHEIWNSYFKFCFERNPWDKVVSLYYFRIGNGMEMTFDEFIRSGYYAQVGNLSGYDFYTGCKNEMLVDNIYLYEDMKNALIEIAKKINLNAIPALPHAKSEYRTNREPYKSMYSDLTKEIVREKFKREIELMNYSFNN